MSSNYRTSDRASASALMRDFDAEPLANALISVLRSRRWLLPTDGHSKAINKRLGSISLLSCAMDAGEGSNAYHAELKAVKALILLRKRGHLEFVSLTKTRMTRGLVSTDPGGFACRFFLRPSVEARVASLIQPTRWIKYGDPIW